METSKLRKLIVKLIQQDFKHQHLIEGLFNLGFEPRYQELEIYAIVCELLSGKNDFEEELFNTYLDYHSRTYPISADKTKEEHFLSLAEECYWQLKFINDKQNEEVGV